MESCGEGVAVFGVGAGAVPGEGDGADSVKEGGDVDAQVQGGVFLEGEFAREDDGGAERITSEVIGVALESGVVFGMETALESEEDVAAEPAPVEAV